MAISEEPNNNSELHFVFSFAGEDRMIVEEIKNQLVQKQYSVFYDNDFKSQLLGKDLYKHLRDIYKNRGKYVVCFISEHYKKKIWTNLELSAIKERLMSTFFASDFLIPIILDNTEMPDDIPEFIGFHKHSSIEETCSFLVQKYNTSLIEDNYISNINNCIQYIVKKIEKKLQSQDLDVCLQGANQIRINGFTGKNDYKFTAEPTANLPCILLYRKPAADTLTKHNIPVILISWNRGNLFLFSLHLFDGFKNNMKTDLPLHELISYLADYIKQNT